MGIDTLFVAGGIHARDLLQPQQQQQQQQQPTGEESATAVAGEAGEQAGADTINTVVLTRLCARYLKHCTPALGAAVAAPTYVTRGFVW